MRKKISITIFFLLISLIGGILYLTGQEHTLIINNVYSNKKLSKNIIIKNLETKDKKIGKNKKVILNLKGSSHKFILEVDGEEKEGIIEFSLNKSGELQIEDFLNDKKDWLKEINQY
ncbi:hypothetical protein NON08_02155 [Cetobacterium somerae]|uniref:hypothetical protein n=1 Tax=Cetobacterium sp. NK01 TaxID=2993530 RepID=UPI0021171FDA|nr:hypothetical protein [Cetobacterium sp. NK01]MCQ8211374.1 hypothetical protein [Cetobacterium sp. NK01]